MFAGWAAAQMAAQERGARSWKSYPTQSVCAAKNAPQGKEIFCAEEVSQQMVQLLPAKKFCCRKHTNGHFQCASIGLVHKKFLQDFSVPVGQYRKQAKPPKAQQAGIQRASRRERKHRD